MPKARRTRPRIVERHDVLIGDVKECGFCNKGDKRFSTAKPDYKYKYRYVPDGTKTANKLRKEHGIKSPYVPAIIDCKKYDNGREVCNTIIGYNPKDWKDL